MRYDVEIGFAIALKAIDPIDVGFQLHVATPAELKMFMQFAILFPFCINVTLEGVSTETVIP